MTNSSAEAIVFDILNEFAEEWGLDDVEVGDQTTLKGDMSFESTDIMQLFVGVQEAFPAVQIPFQELIMADGKFVDDLTARQVIAFVNATLAKSVSPA